jgi:hypothetical protein
VIASLALLPIGLGLLANGCTDAADTPEVSAHVRELAGTWEADMSAYLAAQGLDPGDAELGGLAYREHWRLDGVRVVQSLSAGADTRQLGSWEVLERRGGAYDLRLTTQEGGVSDQAATAVLLGPDSIELTVGADAQQTLRLRRTHRPAAPRR